jgi:hypothetical protein
MCLTISIEVPGLDNRDLREIARALSESDLAFTAHGRGLLRRGRERIELHGCSLLSDDADWNAPTWAMTDEAIEHLSRAFERLNRRIERDFIVDALWSGDTPINEERLSRAQLVALVRRGAVGNKTRYLVSG